MDARTRWLIFERLHTLIPQPQTELRYQTPFELLIAVMLSAQTTDKHVNRVTPALFAQASSPQAMLNLGLPQLETLIQSIGLYRSKARHILGTCAQLLAAHQGQVPAERDALEALTGVGRKTANVILNTVFGQPTVAVDTHLFRLGNRIGLARGKTVRAVEEAYLQTTPPEFLTIAHHLLILHGRYTCTARNPKCHACGIAAWCEYQPKTVAPPRDHL